MRVHSLTMTAVGPYPGTEQIDFDRFAASGRFLLTGPTGAGKTTIIDAIVFALYGQVADSEDSSKARIRSTHAEATTRTVVELVFSTSAGTYRLRRSPEYQRPKKRGGGTTTEKATAHLWRLADPDASPTEEPVSGPREVGVEVARVVGLSREQLTQTVVLPQGKFAQFLRASSAERHQLLRDVFGTGVYDRVQEQIAERSREAKRRSQAARTNLDATVQHLLTLLSTYDAAGSSGGQPEGDTPAEPGPSSTADRSPQPSPAVSAGDGTAQERPEAADGGASASATGTGAAGGSSEAGSESVAGDEGSAGAAGAAAPPVALSTADRLLAASAETPPHPERLSQVLDGTLQASSTRLDQLEGQEAQAQQDRDQATHQLEQVRDLANRLERRRRLLEEQAQQEAQAPQQQEREQRLAQAEAAAHTSTPAQVLSRAQASATASVEAATTLLAQPQPAIVEVSSSAQQGLRLLQDATSSPTLETSASSTPGAPEATEALPGAPVQVPAAQPSGSAAAGSLEDPASASPRLPGTLRSKTASPGSGPEAPASRPTGADAQLPGEELLANATQTLTAAAQSTRQQAGTLTALASTEAGLPQREQDLTAQAAALAQAEQDLSQVEAELSARPAQLEALHARLATAQAAQDSMPALKVAHDQAQARHQAAALADQLTQQHTRAQEAVDAAAQAAQQAEEAVHAQRRRWIATTAGNLAAELEADSPCPVCGSTEHPHPAPVEEGTVSRAQVEAAEARASQARQCLQDAVLQRQSLQERLEAAVTQAGNQAQAQTSAALQAAQQELATAQQAAQPLKELEEQSAGFTQATARLAQEAAAAKARNQAAAAALQVQQEALEADTQKVRQAQDGSPSVQARIAALTQRAEAYEACAQALTRCLADAQAVAQAHTDLAQVLRAEGLASLQQAQSLRLPPAELKALRTQVDDARAQRQRLRLALAEPEIATLTGQEQADLPAAQEARTQADTRHTQAVRALERARSQHQALEDACTSVQDAATSLQEVTASQAALLRVAALVSGDNDLATPLATWVLVERFQEVLVFANQRLAEMSSGRYQLTHVDHETGSARRKDRGLGLGIIDHLGDQAVRDPKTLSGGETFYVSLSLALALADVVATESGGITMETLFIDEGFGTLDPETLDKVMAELARLQAGGRTVGIVSHVEELRRQIADRIEVRRTATGSTLRQTAT